MKDDRTIAIVKATAGDAAEIRYRIAVKLNRLVIANRMARRLDTWIVRDGAGQQPRA
jgi:hypothetical protein